MGIIEIKDLIEPRQVYDWLCDIGAEPVEHGSHYLCRTICHNHDGCGSRKLYYYIEDQLFVCYSNCGTMDIFNFVQELGYARDLTEAILYVKRIFNIDDATGYASGSSDNKFFEAYHVLLDKLSRSERRSLVELEEVHSTVFDNLPQPRIASWEQEHITKEMCDRFDIKYDPLNHCIVIPHKDINGRIIGIRQRTLVGDTAERFGKYMPWNDGKRQYNHALGVNLYGIHEARKFIEGTGIAVVAESEKAVLQAFGYGLRNTVAMCGSNFSRQQFDILRSLGVKEIVFAIDKDFTLVGNEDYQKVKGKLKSLSLKYGNDVKVSFMFDRKSKYTGHKQSPFDCGKEVAYKLLKERNVL